MTGRAVFSERWIECAGPLLELGQGCLRLPWPAILWSRHKTQQIDFFWSPATAMEFAGTLVYIAIASPFTVSMDHWA